MAHKQCIKGMRLNHLCDCIKDDIIELELIKNNIQNLDKIIAKIFKKNDWKMFMNFEMKDLIKQLKLRLVIEN